MCLCYVTLVCMISVCTSAVLVCVCDVVTCDLCSVSVYRGKEAGWTGGTYGVCVCVCVCVY